MHIIPPVAPRFNVEEASADIPKKRNPVQQSCENLTHSFHFGYRDRHSDNTRSSGRTQSFRLHEPCPEGAGHWELPDYQVLDVPIRICGGLALRRHPTPKKLSAETTLIESYTLISSTEVTW